jgi:integrase/recombinase XerD
VTSAAVSPRRTMPHEHTSPAYLRLAPTPADDDTLIGFSAWMDSWGASPNTTRQRISVISTGLAVWGDSAGVRTVDLSDWLANPRLAAWTRVTYYQHLKSYFGWLYDTEQIPVDPTVKLRTPRAPKDVPRPLSPEDVKRVLEAAHGNLRAWLLLGLLAGLRVHEIAKLRGQDVDERSIYVIGKGKKPATVSTHPDLWVLAQRYPRQGYWFPSRYGSRTPHIAGTSVSAMVTRHFRALGIEGSAHRTRHSFATSLLRGGANIRVVQTLMRHESLATTAKYTAVDEQETMAALRRIGLP